MNNFIQSIAHSGRPSFRHLTFHKAKELSATSLTPPSLPNQVVCILQQQPMYTIIAVCTYAPGDLAHDSRPSCLKTAHSEFAAEMHHSFTNTQVSDGSGMVFDGQMHSTTVTRVIRVSSLELQASSEQAECIPLLINSMPHASCIRDKPVNCLCKQGVTKRSDHHRLQGLRKRLKAPISKRCVWALRDWDLM